MNPKVRETVLVGVLLAGLLLIFFSGAVFGDQVLSPADGIFVTPFFAELAPTGFTLPSNQVLFDPVYQFTPWRYFAWKMIRQGQLPLWNPYSLSGTSFVATMQAAIFYPINLLLVILPFERTLVWSAILRLWIAGIFTYMLTRRYGLGKASSLIAAVSFMLSGFLVVWLEHPHTNVAVWLPALILLGELLLQASTSKQVIRYIALLALVIGIQFTGGHIEISVDILFAFGLYYLLRWIQIIRPLKISFVAKIIRLALFPIVAILLGSALAGIHLLPFLEWLPLSAELQIRTRATFRLIDIGSWKNLLTLPLMVFPNLNNNPTWGYSYWSFIPLSSNPLYGGSYLDFVLYIGVLSFAFAFVALCNGCIQDKSLIKIWLIIGLVAIGRAFNFPIFDWINQLPLFSMTLPGRLRLIFAFSQCLLAGFGAEALWDAISQNRMSTKKLWTRLCGGIAFLGLAMAIGSNTVLPLLKDWVTAYGKHLVDIEFGWRTTHSHPLEYYYAQVEKMVGGLMAAFKVDNIAMYMPAYLALAGLIVVVWSARYFTPPRLRILKVTLLFLVIIDLTSFGKDFNPSIPVSRFYPETSIVSYINRDVSLFRFTALRQDLIPDTQMMFNLQDFRGLTHPTYWYDNYLNLIPERIPWLQYGAIFSSVNSPLLRVLNVKYIAASTSSVFEIDRNMKVELHQDDIYLGEMLNVQPRSFMVYDAVITSSDDEALHLLKESPELVFRRVLLSDTGIVPTDSHVGKSESTSENHISEISYQPNETIWKVATDENGYLVNSDAFYPGWKAYIDGHPTTLYRANVAFRAVYVLRGEHILVFRFEPSSVFWGGVITAFSVCVILFLLFWSYWQVLSNSLRIQFGNGYFE